MKGRKRNHAAFVSSNRQVMVDLQIFQYRVVLEINKMWIVKKSQ